MKRIKTATKIVFMGVCGCGKSTLAIRAAQYLGCQSIIEADAYHHPEMKEKMRASVPLTDDDRWPWLDKINEAMRATPHEWTVVTCSALRRAYRERLARDLGNSVYFIFLDAPREVISDRLTKRQHEYMPASLLDSQFAALERPQPDEPVSIVSVAESEDEAFQVIKTILDELTQDS